MSTTIANVAQWAETASAGDYLAYYSQMTVEQTGEGTYRVTGDASGNVIWEGEATNSDAAYAAAERANEHGSLCGFSEMVLDDAKQVLRRGNLRLEADDMGLRVVGVQS